MCSFPGETVENTTGVAFTCVRIDCRHFFFAQPELTQLQREESKEQRSSVAECGMTWLGLN